MDKCRGRLIYAAIISVLAGTGKMRYRFMTRRYWKASARQRAVRKKFSDSKARQKVILKAVDDLPAKLRKIVILFEFEEFSYEQIAKKTGLPQGTVKSRLFNAAKF